MDKDILKLITDMRKKEEDLKKRFGDIRHVIHIEAKGNRFIAVGDRLYYSDRWKTFPDFLWDYILDLFGEKWFEAEKAKKSKDRHPIMLWRYSSAKFQKTQKKNKDGFYYCKPSGPYKAYLTVSYDLYLLKHHQSLQKTIVKRLKNIDQFQGARYELFVTSTMIRLGFEILHEDESDKRKKHVEFFAKNKKNDEIIAIEAKSRHRRRILSRPGHIENPDNIRLRVGGLINKAIEKKPNYPYFVFIDLNLPPEKTKKLKLNELIKTLNTAKKSDDDKDYFNMILYTNFPYHYGDELTEYPEDHLSVVISQDPVYPLTNPSIINDIQVAVKKYGMIPNKFSD